MPDLQNPSPPSDRWEELAASLLEASLTGVPWREQSLDELVAAALSSEAAVAAAASRALFSVLVEGLADPFEPRLCDTYAALFARVLQLAYPQLDAAAIQRRYELIRKPRAIRQRDSEVGKVFVLSRVTLGADAAITSVMLDAAHRRFPDARIYLAGSRKAWELFEQADWVLHQPVAYTRSGLLRDRLAASASLGAVLDDPQAIVIDPDSRLSQLGLVPMADASRYYFFESRSAGGEATESLYTLARRWAAETFEVANVQPFLAPAASPDPEPGPYISVSLGVGDNLAKRVAGDFEPQLIRELASLGVPVWIDEGAGDQERGRVHQAVAAAGDKRHLIRIWSGAYAPFARRILDSSLYVGYDSAGQHVAAVGGVPLVTVFAGAVSDRMFQRWTPESDAPVGMIRVLSQTPVQVLQETLASILSSRAHLQ
jgi:ADP-heptose:LPS heptosyltransferase